jgi:4-hydroxy 2-oxovalerate aldolase
MKTTIILDCTLRDGGFVNDWNFGIGSIENIISRLDKAGIDIIEIGFLDKKRVYDVNRSIQPDTESIKPIFQNLNIKTSMIVAMIDFGTLELTALTEQKDSCIDGIRVIFKKKDQLAALAFCSEIKKKGYKLFVNPVSITSYSDNEMIDLIGKINQVGPYSMALVDTYGLLHKNELLHYYGIMDKHLERSIIIGYHAHNNFQLAYSNSIELMAVDSERTLMIDGSLFGMGKGAGNTCTELIAMYLNENYGKKYGIDQLLEAIDVDISKEYAKKYWGYSLMHFIAASNDCHPDYVSNLISKKTLSVMSINEILSGIPEINKLTYNRELLETMYASYQDKAIDDSAAYADLGKDLADKNILILAPGKSIEINSGRIGDFIKEKNPAVITINFINDDYKPDYVFMGNAKRYSQFYNKIYKRDSDVRVICTSNVSESNKKIDYKFNFNSLINEDKLIRDNPVLMLLKVLVKMKVKNVYMAGFDGYSPDNEKNYPVEYIQFLYCDDDVVLRNEAVKKALAVMGKSIKLEFLTPSFYI